MEKIKRRNFLPKKSFQIRLILKVFLTFLIVLVLLSTAICFIHIHAFDQSKGQVHSFIGRITGYYEGNKAPISGPRMSVETKVMGNKILKALQSLEKNIFIAFAGAVIFSFIIVAALFLLFTHRIAGAVYHFEKSLIAVKNGDFSSQLHLRERDEFQYLSCEFNNMTNALNTKMDAIKNSISILKDKIELTQIDTQIKDIFFSDIKEIQGYM